MVAALAAFCLAQRGGAQDLLARPSTATSGIVVDAWHFSTPVSMTTSVGDVAIGSVNEWTIPVAVVVPFSDRLALDAYIAQAHGSVNLQSPDANGLKAYTLTGVTDAKLRLVAHLRGDNVLLTIGGTVPTGMTKLNPNELIALSALSSPTMRFRTPILGAGAGVTTGLIAAGSMGDWAVASGLSFEMRGTYAPAEALQASVNPQNLKPGNAVHFSLGLDRLIGQSRHSLGLIGDFYTGGSLSADSAGRAASSFKLGPSVTASYQIQLGTTNFTSSVYALERFRSASTAGDTSIAGTGRSETEAGYDAVFGQGALALRLGADFRLQTSSAATGTEVTFATAGFAGGGVTAGLPYRRSDRFSAEPFVHLQAGRFSLGPTSTMGTGLTGGFTLTASF